MKSKDKVKTALKHRSPDEIPIDFGGTAVTGIHVLSVARLREYLGLEQQPVRVTEPYQMLGEIDEELSEILGIDTIGLIPKNNMFGFANENWKECQMPWGQVVLVPGDFNTTKTQQGGILMYPEGDTSVSACAEMPAASYFFDAIIRQDPIHDDALNPEENLEEFSLLQEEDLKYWETEINKYVDSGKALVATFGGTAFGDIALVPAMQLRNPRGIRDITEWYMSTITRRDYIHAVFERQCEVGLENLKKIFKVVGNDIDVVFICGTDFGSQTSQFCSNETYDNLYAPYYKRINDWIHKNTSWKSFKHSCGAVEPLMNNFIASGFDIINPVQITAAGMDPTYLKKTYGENIVFWGGGVDTQKVLPFGKPEEVTNQVLYLCEIFSKNGGFIFNTIHNIQANIPVENIIAMFNGVRKFNGQDAIY